MIKILCKSITRVKELEIHDKVPEELEVEHVADIFPDNTREFVKQNKELKGIL